MLGARRARIRSYARFYEPFRNLVLTGTAAAPEDPPLRALEPLLQIGRVLLVETPQSMQPLSAESAYKRPTMPQMPVVSADPHADALAHQHGVEIVASSSVLCALFQTVGPDFHQTWQIPIVVKKHGGRAVAYLDKPLIRPKYDMREKNGMFFQTAYEGALVRKPSDAAPALVLKACGEPRLGCECFPGTAPIPLELVQDNNVCYHTWQLGDLKFLVRSRIHGWVAESNARVCLLGWSVLRVCVMRWCRGTGMWG